MTQYDPLAIITDLYHTTDVEGVITIPFMHNMRIQMDWDGKDCRRIREQFNELYLFLNEMTTWNNLLNDNDTENSHILPSYEYKMWKKWLCPFDLSQFDKTELHAIHMKHLNHTALSASEGAVCGSFRKALKQQADQRIGQGLFSDQLIHYARSAVRQGCDNACDPSEAETLAILFAIHACGLRIM